MSNSQVSLPPDFDRAQNEFNIALANGLRVAKRCTNLETDRVGKIADQFHSKNIITSLTVKFIINPPARVGYPGMPPSFTAWDLPSLCVLSRCLLETYLTMFYLCVDSVSAEERDFRLLWWDWHETAERVRLAETYGSLDPRLPGEREARGRLCGRITGHAFFLQQTPQRRRQIEAKLKTDRKEALLTSKSQIAVAAGIHIDQYRHAYDYLSQFAHALPLANRAIDGFTLDRLALSTRWATAWLAFTIRDFLKLFPNGKDATDAEFWQLVGDFSYLLAGDLSKVKEA